MKFDTRSIHAGRKPDPTTGAISTSICQTSTFVFEDYQKPGEYDYSRTGNPTRNALEDAVASLEGGNRGFAFSSGMAAVSTAVHLLKEGDHAVVGDDIYGGTHRLFSEIMTNYGIEFTFTRLDSRENIEDAIQDNTKMLWIETPSNPLLNITDLELVSDIAMDNQLLTVADNTFPSPYFLRPIEYGIDLVLHSTTKYINGHSDVIGGAIITTTNELADKVHFLLNGMGTNAAPFDSWLILRGLKTLPLRMKKHAENAAGHSRIFMRTLQSFRGLLSGSKIPSWPFHCKKTDGRIWWCSIIQTEIGCGEFYKRVRPIFTCRIPWRCRFTC